MRPAPIKPTEQEVQEGSFTWEYDQEVVEVATMGDPPHSRPPIVVIRRRMVSRWETFNPEVHYGE